MQVHVHEFEFDTCPEVEQVAAGFTDPPWVQTWDQAGCCVKIEFRGGIAGNRLIVILKKKGKDCKFTYPF